MAEITDLVTKTYTIPLIVAVIEVVMISVQNWENVNIIFLFPYISSPEVLH